MPSGSAAPTQPPPRAPLNDTDPRAPSNYSPIRRANECVAIVPASRQPRNPTISRQRPAARTKASLCAGARRLRAIRAGGAQPSKMISFRSRARPPLTPRGGQIRVRPRVRTCSAHLLRAAPGIKLEERSRGDLKGLPPPALYTRAPVYFPGSEWIGRPGRFRCFILQMEARGAGATRKNSRGSLLPRLIRAASVAPRWRY